MADKIDRQEIILDYIKNNGPVIPIEISKVIRGDSLIASALLSGMVSMNQLKVSKMKIGGSPLYFMPGQESMLQNFADKLAMGEKGVYNLLRTRKILMDRELNQVQREALQRIKDFAVLLEVEIPGRGIKEIFWKWYLLGDAETESLIKNTLRRIYAPKAEKPKAPAEEKIIPKAATAKTEESKPEEVQQTEGEKKEKLEKPKRKERVKKEVKRKFLKKKELETKPEEEKKGTKFKIEEELLKIQEEETEAKKKDKPKTPAMLEKENKANAFITIVQDYFRKNDIQVLETEVIKPNEIDFVVKVPSAVGKISYYCKAKDKKSVNEGDLSTAFVQGQLKKMPVLFLSNGKLTKRADEMLEKQFQHMNIAYINQQQL